MNAIHRNTSTITCGITRTHLTSHSQRLRWPSSCPSTCSGYMAGVACTFMARTPLKQHGCAGGGVKVSRGSPALLLDARAAIEVAGNDCVRRNPEVPRTDLLLQPSYSLSVTPSGHRSGAVIARQSGVPAMAGPRVASVDHNPSRGGNRPRVELVAHPNLELLP